MTRGHRALRRSSVRQACSDHRCERGKGRKREGDPASGESHPSCLLSPVGGVGVCSSRTPVGSVTRRAAPRPARTARRTGDRRRARGRNQRHRGREPVETALDQPAMEQHRARHGCRASERFSDQRLASHSGRPGTGPTRPRPPRAPTAPRDTPRGRVERLVDVDPAIEVVRRRAGGRSGSRRRSSRRSIVSTSRYAHVAAAVLPQRCS